jgi:dTDP-4-amino-4,6-dideoxygalactose transaminase
MTTAEGGMVTTDEPELAKQLKIAALQVLSADAWSRFSDAGYKHYEVVTSGFKYNMTDIQAALGICQLPKLERWLKRREAIWARYDEAFRDLPCVTPAAPEPHTRHARHLYTLLVDLERASVGRDALIMRLHERKIGTGVHYLALHRHPFYQALTGVRPDELPNADWVGARTLSLPLAANLTDAEVDRIIDAVRDTLTER